MHLKELGIWSAISAALFGLLYIAALVLTVIGFLPKPWDTFWQLLPSLFLAWAFMVMMVCLHKASLDERNLWTLVGLAFAIVYATINSIVYFSVLTVTVPGILNGKADELSLILFEPGKFLFHINGLAYGLMSVATLFASNAFVSKGREAKVKWTMLAHGLIGPFIVGAVLWPL